jgi:Histidine kinase-, DNA gyrase B-, and HSP90-like ATPase
VRPFAETKRQALALTRVNEPVRISGDRSSLRRLIWTLLDNAVKYTPACGRIEVALQKVGPEARITVRDSGIGIPEAMLPRIFDRFFRADPSRSEADGAGLGSPSRSGSPMFTTRSSQCKAGKVRGPSLQLYFRYRPNRFPECHKLETQIGDNDPLWAHLNSSQLGCCPLRFY